MANELGIGDFISILLHAASTLKNRTPDGQPDNPPGWEDKGSYGDPGGAVAIAPPTSGGGPQLAPPSTGWAGTPVDPGVAYGPPVEPGSPWHGRAYASGKFASVLTDEQAQAFHVMMDIMGHNGDTVGRGAVHPILPTEGKVRAE